MPADAFAGFMKIHPEMSFLCVNDGSRDNTGEVLKKLCAANPNAALLELTDNCGKAEAVRQGMLHAADTGVRFIGFLDADLATPPEELTGMLASAWESVLCISGCRLVRLGSAITRSPWRHFAGRIFATAASLYLNLPVYDTQCGAKLYAAEAVGSIFQKPFVTKWFFDVEILRRLLRLYGRERILADTLEYPLRSWADRAGSKIRFFPALADFIRLLLSKD